MSTYKKPPRTQPRPPTARPADRTPRPDGASGAAQAEGERIARRLARVGLASRREAEAMIAAGRVSVNGKVLSTPAVNVADSDVILVDGQPLPARERTRLFLFHKPAGTMATNRDPEGRRTVFDVLPKNLPRLITVGRLDFATEGLLLLTNDGGLARLLELPSTGWLRRYRVRVHGQVDQAALDRLKEGIAVDGVLYGAIEAVLDRVQGSNAWLTMALREGKNREVRNVLGALGLDVTRLIRVSYGPFQLGELPEGAVMELKGRTLRDQLGPRLIAAAGADFEAEIRQPFSNAPTRAEPAAAAPAAPETKRAPRSPGGTKVGREEALKRLDTRPDARPGSRAGKRPADKPAFDKRSAGKPAYAKSASDRPGSGRPTSEGSPSGKPQSGKPAFGKPAFGKSASDKSAGPARRGQGPAGPGGPEKSEGQHSRTANVWRAPGARPLGPDKLKKKKAADAKGARRGSDRPKPTGKPRGGHADRRR